MITIAPFNDEIAKRLNALKILNGFLAMGISERKAFVQVIMDECPELNNLQGMNKLNNFWATRDFTLNDTLEKILTDLKQS